MLQDIQRRKAPDSSLRATPQALAGIAAAATLAAILSPVRAGETPGANPAADLSEVVVNGRRDRDTTTISPQARELVSVPGALGDPLRGVFSLPGVVYAGGDTGEPAVRGSGPGDNLYLVDSLPVPYVFHSLDIGASVFSDLVLGSFDLRPAAFGAEYANVTGAVFDIGLRDPRRQALTTTLDLSMLRSGLFVESAVGEHGAAYLSARTSLIHLFVDPDSETDGVRLAKPPRDDDYQAKYVIDAGDRHRFTFAANGASDRAAASFSARSQLAARDPDFGGDARLDTRYDQQAVTWDYAPAAGTRLRIAAAHSRQDDGLRYGQGYFEDTQLDRKVVRALLDQPLAMRHTLQVTAQVQRDRREVAYRQVLFVCNEFDPTCADDRRAVVSGRPTLPDTQYSVGVSDTWRPAPRLRIDAGALWRRSSFTGESFVEPRGAIEWQSGPRTSFALRAGRYSQFPDTAAVLPGIGNPGLRSPRATHVALSLRHELDNGWSAVVEPYAKRFSGLPLALDPAAPDAAKLYANDIRGRADGIDVLVRAPRDARLSGWLSMSWSRSDRTDERTGATSRYYLDTPLLANAVLSWKWRPRVEVGARLTLRSGQPDTPIVATVANPLFPDRVSAVYGTPYSARLPDYVRLDLRVKRDFTLRGRAAWVALDLINATGASNVSARALDYVKTVPGGPLYFETEEGLGPLPVISFRITL